MSFSNEIRVLGIDDLPHTRLSAGSKIQTIATLFRGGKSMDGLLSAHVTLDGDDSTTQFIKMINKSRIKSQLHAILTDGVTFAGFNVLDINMLNRKTSVPVISVMRQIPNLKKIKRALKNVNNYDKKWSLIEKAGDIYEMEISNYSLKKPEKIHFQCAGISPEKASEILQITTLHGVVPEPLRLAHIIGSGLAFGESKGRA